MNWTEGNLARVSRGHKGNGKNGIVFARQKEHFAKARNRLSSKDTKPKAPSSFLNGLVSLEPEHGDNDDYPRSPASPRHLSPVVEERSKDHSKSSTSKRKKKRSASISPKVTHNNDPTEPSIPDDMRMILERRKRQLLDKTDWVGTNLRTPEELQFNKPCSRHRPGWSKRRPRRSNRSPAPRSFMIQQGEPRERLMKAGKHRNHHHHHDHHDHENSPRSSRRDRPEKYRIRIGSQVAASTTAPSQVATERTALPRHQKAPLDPLNISSPDCQHYRERTKAPAHSSSQAGDREGRVGNGSIPSSDKPEKRRRRARSNPPLTIHQPVPLRPGVSHFLRRRPSLSSNYAESTSVQVAAPDPPVPPENREENEMWRQLVAPTESGVSGSGDLPPLMYESTRVSPGISEWRPHRHSRSRMEEEERKRWSEVGMDGEQRKDGGRSYQDEEVEEEAHTRHRAMTMDAEHKNNARRHHSDQELVRGEAEPMDRSKSPKASTYVPRWKEMAPSTETIHARGDAHRPSWSRTGEEASKRHDEVSMDAEHKEDERRHHPEKEMKEEAHTRHREIPMDAGHKSKTRRYDQTEEFAPGESIPMSTFESAKDIVVHTPQPKDMAASTKTNHTTSSPASGHSSVVDQSRRGPSAIVPHILPAQDTPRDKSVSSSEKFPSSPPLYSVPLMTVPETTTAGTVGTLSPVQEEELDDSLSKGSFARRDSSKGSSVRIDSPPEVGVGTWMTSTGSRQNLHKRKAPPGSMESRPVQRIPLQPEPTQIPELQTWTKDAKPQDNYHILKTIGGRKTTGGVSIPFITRPKTPVTPEESWQKFIFEESEDEIEGAFEEAKREAARSIVPTVQSVCREDGSERRTWISTELSREASEAAREKTWISTESERARVAPPELRRTTLPDLRQEGFLGRVGMFSTAGDTGARGASVTEFETVATCGTERGRGEVSGRRVMEEELCITHITAGETSSVAAPISPRVEIERQQHSASVMVESQRLPATVSLQELELRRGVPTTIDTSTTADAASRLTTSSVEKGDGTGGFKWAPPQRFGGHGGGGVKRNTRAVRLELMEPKRGGKARRKRFDRSGRMDIRGLPDFDGDPIEE